MSQEKNWVPQPKGEGTYNEIWKPIQEGDTIEGTLVNVQSGIGPNRQWVYDIRVEDGTVYTVWGKHILDGQLNGVPIQSYIKIEFIGKKQTKKGNTFYDFNVFVAAEQAPVPAPVQADVKDSDPALNQPPAAPAPVAAEPVPVAATAPAADVPVAEPQAVNENAAPVAPAPAAEEEGSDLPF